MKNDAPEERATCAPPVLVSACLAGLRTRYDGAATPCDEVVALLARGRAIPFCPELHGGLGVPRRPCEIRDGHVVTDEGLNVTPAFVLGAEEGLRLARMAGCTEAILKSRSPSCGCGEIHDGTFSRTLIPGNGVFAELLLESGIAVRTELDLSAGGGEDGDDGRERKSAEGKPGED